MSLFTKVDYTQKNQKNVMVKTKLPTESKTKKHKCSQCTRTDAELIPISENEKRWLCSECVGKFLAQNEVQYFVNFMKAGQMSIRGMKDEV